MGTLVMPAAVLASVLAPLGLEMIGLWPMDLGLRWILGVAHFIADQEDALRHVVTPPPLVIGLIALGGIFGVLWRGSLRVLGLAPLACGFLLWNMAERPTILVADSGSLIGVIVDEGRAVSKERGESFAASVWLENDGAPVEQRVAYTREGLREEGRSVWVNVADTKVVNVRGVTALAALNGCGGADVLITNQETSQADCETFDINRLRDTGSLAGWVEDGKLHWVTARDISGRRLWNTREVREDRGPVARLLSMARVWN